MDKGSITKRRNAPTARFAVALATLCFCSLAWFATTAAAAPATPVPCAPGSASCLAANGTQTTATTGPTTPASGLTEPGQGTSPEAPPAGGGDIPDKPANPGGNQGAGNGGNQGAGKNPGGNQGTGRPGGTRGPGNTGNPPPVIPDGNQPDFVEDDPGLNGGVGPGDSDDGDPITSDRLTVPNFVIDQFEIPPFLLPIYQACGSQYGIPWYVLASINRAETTFGTNLGTSSAGAIGWMMFMPTSWAEWGVDANGDGIKDPYNPVDAICAAGNYLEYFGYAEDPYDAIFAYNHADWYVQLILKYARIYSQIPPEMLSALTGLTEGARFPVASPEATYEGQISTEGARRNGTASQNVQASSDRRTIAISGPGGSPVIAVNDGMIREIDAQTGRVVLEDVYGNRYSYAGLGSISTVHPVPRPRPTAPQTVEESDVGHPADHDHGDGPAPDADAGMGEAKASDSPRRPGNSNPQVQAEARPEPTEKQKRDISEVLVDPDAGAVSGGGARTETPAGDPALAAADERRDVQSQLRQEAPETGNNTEDMRGRVYASPTRPSNHRRASTDGQSIQNAIRQAEGIGIEGRPGDYLIYDGSRSGIYHFDPETTELLELKKGSRVVAGTVLGRLAETATAEVNFSIKPGGEDTPQIDPKPFLDGWKLLAETNIYSARGRDRFSNRLGAGGILLLSKSALQKRVLSNEMIEFTQQCDRDYIAGGSIDRRVLATLEFITAHGYSMLITSMLCGREGSITTSGNVSNHTRGSAIDIAAINGEVVTAGTQGPGSLTDQVARLVLSLQGTMTPNEVISLLSYPHPAGFAMGDHDDHLHVGFSPMAGSDEPGGSIASSLGAEQWEALTERLGQIRNPEVPTTPSADSLPAKADRGRGD